MLQVSGFAHSVVCVKTHDDVLYTGTLLALDRQMNTVLQDVSNDIGDARPSLFIKGSNILYISLKE